MVELDEKDFAILAILQKDARTSHSKIAREVGLSDVTVRNRIKRMTQAQVIEGFYPKVDLEKIGFGTKALIGLKLEKLFGERCEKMHKQLESMEEVREVHHVAGDFDCVLKVYAKDTGHLRELIFDKIPQIEGFSGLKTFIVLGTSIEKTGVPVETQAKDMKEKSNPSKNILKESQNGSPE
jgi:Lrp/AsnC family transcriptional regulator for asnA, asnC and gidA